MSGVNLNNLRDQLQTELDRTCQSSWKELTLFQHENGYDAIDIEVDEVIHTQGKRVLHRYDKKSSVVLIEGSYECSQTYLENLTKIFVDGYFSPKSWGVVVPVKADKYLENINTLI